jgi:hypothetical protein
MGGVLALLAAFLLALPGVKAVRAESGQAPVASGDGAQCQQNAPEASVVQSGATAQELQARIAAQIAAQAGPGEAPVVLNTRGYNYASGRSQLEQIAADAERLGSQH